MDKWIQHTKNIETFDYNTESWVGEALSQNAKCFNCGRIGHLRGGCRQEIPRNNISSGNGKSRRPQPSGICRKCGKG